MAEGRHSDPWFDGCHNTLGARLPMLREGTCRKRYRRYGSLKGISPLWNYQTRVWGAWWLWVALAPRLWLLQVMGIFTSTMSTWRREESVFWRNNTRMLFSPPPYTTTVCVCGWLCLRAWLDCWIQVKKWDRVWCMIEILNDCPDMGSNITLRLCWWGMISRSTGDIHGNYMYLWFSVIGLYLSFPLLFFYCLFL